jgi:two-component system cell cycle sensor histidine kinase/response regulator CckA
MTSKVPPEQTMPMRRKFRPRLTPARLAAIYVLVSTLWVLVTSELVFIEAKSPAAITRIEMAKGLLFIVATAALLFWVAHRLLGRLLKSEQSLQVSARKLTNLQEHLLQSQKLESLGRLAGGIAHDFNNILNVILQASYLLRAETKDKGRSHVQMIIKAADRGTALTRQLLAFSRRQALHPRATKLNDVVQQTSDLLQVVLADKVVIKLALQPELWEIMADPDQIAQVVMNLCLNARDAMPDGGIIEIRTRNITSESTKTTEGVETTGETSVLLIIKDTGVGASLEVQQQMFEPFFSTKGAGKGTGLGLSIVYGIVKQSGGSIDVNSRLGQGTEFRIYFPPAPKASAAQLSAANRDFKSA